MLKLTICSFEAQICSLAKYVTLKVALISLGMSGNAARMLVYLQNVDGVSLCKIQNGTGRRLPEIDIVAKNLKKHGWINWRDIKKINP